MSAAETERFFEELTRRAPNGFRLDRLPRPIADMSSASVDEAVNSLVQRGVIRRVEHTSEILPGRKYTIIEFVNPDQYPARDTIRVGDVDLPRMVLGDIVGAEDLNYAIETMAIIDDEARRRNEEVMGRVTRRYWANTATLLGTFLAVFALVLRSSEPLVIGDRDPRDILLLKAAEIGPLAIVLVLFVGLTYVLLRRI